MGSLLAILSTTLMLSGCFTAPKDSIGNIVISCLCASGENPIISFKDKSGNHLIICGRMVKKTSDNTYHISEYKITDCKNRGEIYDQSEDAVSISFVEVETDSIVLTDTHFILNSINEIEAVPVIERTIKYVSSVPKVSSDRNVFIRPKLTKDQVISLTKLIEDLNAISKKGVTQYPYDEKSIYLLLIGAINNNKEAGRILRNLDKLFIIDGAIAETRNEIWIKY